VGGAVDAARQAADDDQLVLSEVMRETSGKPAGCGRGISSPDDRKRLPIEQIEVASRDQQRRRVFQLCQQPRIEALPDCQPPPAEPVDSGDLPFCVVAGPERRRFSPATPGEIGNRRQCIRRRSESHDQLAESDGPYAGCPQQSQTLD
jgi:hypothetical protein